MEKPRFNTEEVTRCLVCNGGRRTLLFRGQDERHDYPGFFPVVQCDDCGLAYLGSRVDAAAIGLLYEKYYALEAKGKKPTGLLDFLKAQLKNSWVQGLYDRLIGRQTLYGILRLTPGARILDVGSGETVFDARRVIRGGGEWMGVEVDPSICKTLEAAGLAHFCGTLEEFLTRRAAPFDYILLSQVLEHIYRPRQFMEAARSMLRPGGMIMLSCPNYDSFLRIENGEKWLHWHVPYHVAHYNRQTLTLLAEDAGFKLVAFGTSTPAEWYFAQRHMVKGLKSKSYQPGKFQILQQRLLNKRLAPYHKLDRGDAIVAKLQRQV